MADREGEGDSKNAKTYPIVRFSDMPEDTKSEIIDMITGAIDRYLNDMEAACKEIKALMERSYGEGWLVVVGESFSFEVTYQVNHMIHMYYLGYLGILVWKCV